MVLMWVAPLVEAIDLLFVAHQRKCDRRTQLEAVLDGKLLVDASIMVVISADLASRSRRLPRATSKKCAIAVR
jgi:hypothetical protein